MKKNAGGFSLIELALVMIIVGVMYASGFTAYAQYLKQKRLDDTFETMRLINGAFTEFVARNGYYPCPARRTASPSDADYGVSTCVPTSPGMKRIDTGRDAGEDKTGDTEAILIGAIPFNTMNLSAIDNRLLASSAIDAWGNKFTYAVTEILTTQTTFNDAWGVIRITDEYGQSVVTPADSAHLVFFTHGPDGKGAYSAEGQSVDPCNVIALPPPNPPPLNPPLVSQIENCDELDGNFVNGIAKCPSTKFLNRKNHL